MFLSMGGIQNTAGLLPDALISIFISINNKLYLQVKASTSRAQYV